MCACIYGCIMRKLKYACSPYVSAYLPRLECVCGENVLFEFLNQSHLPSKSFFGEIKFETLMKVHNLMVCMQ